MSTSAGAAVEISGSFGYGCLVLVGNASTLKHHFRAHRLAAGCSGYKPRNLLPILARTLLALVP